MRYIEATIATLGLFISSSWATYCEAAVYSGAGPGNTCTGQEISKATNNGGGMGTCHEAYNAACVIIGDDTDEVHGDDCEVNMYVGDCNAPFLVDQLDCNEIGDVLQVNFDHYRIDCF